MSRFFLFSLFFYTDASRIFSGAMEVKTDCQKISKNYYFLLDYMVTVYFTI